MLKISGNIQLTQYVLANIKCLNNPKFPVYFGKNNFNSLTCIFGFIANIGDCTKHICVSL